MIRLPNPTGQIDRPDEKPIGLMGNLLVQTSVWNPYNWKGSVSNGAF